MKILICTSFPKEHLGTHCSAYYPELFRQVFSALGHSVDFTGLRIDPIPDHNKYDMLFLWGLESYIGQEEFVRQLVSDFKGKKVLYITTKKAMDFFSYMDLIVGTDIEGYGDFYRTRFPHSKYITLPFASPMYYWVDADDSDPYKGAARPRIIYTGLFDKQRLACLTALARAGYHVYLGGKFLDYKKPSRALVESEIKTLHKNIHLISKTGKFSYGEHWPWLKHADLAINMYPGPVGNAVSSKLVDYLVCGLPVVSEESAPNNIYLGQMGAGFTCRYNDPEHMVSVVKKAIAIKWNRDNILASARATFDPLTIGKQILEASV